MVGILSLPSNFFSSFGLSTTFRTFGNLHFSLISTFEFIHELLFVRKGNFRSMLDLTSWKVDSSDKSKSSESWEDSAMELALFITFGPFFRAHLALLLKYTWIRPFSFLPCLGWLYRWLGFLGLIGTSNKLSFKSRFNMSFFNLFMKYFFWALAHWSITWDMLPDLLLLALVYLVRIIACQIFKLVWNWCLFEFFRCFIHCLLIILHCIC